MAYGIKQKLEGPADISSEGKMVPSYTESLEEYNYLVNADKLAISNHRSRHFDGMKYPPSLWPVEGLLMDGYARRTDPFSGEGSFHKGVDITAPTGTVVRTTADGVVVQAEMVPGGYGRLIIVDHGGGFQTYYAHLSKILVRAGQELRRGEVIGLVGSSGRTTAPHLHYEVRSGGAPINPYKYLANSSVYRQAPKDMPFQAFQ
jgi:murein DD-endopeptidase MepM/ murein hydrolase activator NlpD